MNAYDRFVKLLEGAGEKVSDVSRDTGIRQGVFTDWKMGRYTPKADKLAKIAEHFGVPVGYFLDVEESEHPAGYYLNEETAKVAQEIFEDPDLRVLFDAARDCSPDDLRLAADFLRRLKKTNPEG